MSLHLDYVRLGLVSLLLLLVEHVYPRKQPHAYHLERMLAYYRQFERLNYAIREKE